LITTDTSQVCKGAWIANLQPHPSLQNIVDSSIKLKDVMGSAPPPNRRQQCPRMAFLPCASRLLVYLQTCQYPFPHPIPI
ncbi:MAG: hypothetical protein ACK53Y_07335, partial [bacterium]